MEEGADVPLMSVHSDEMMNAVLATQLFGGLPRARIQGIPWCLKSLKVGEEVAYSGQYNSAGVVLAGTCWVMASKPRGRVTPAPINSHCPQSNSSLSETIQCLLTSIYMENL